MAIFKVVGGLFSFVWGLFRMNKKIPMKGLKQKEWEITNGNNFSRR
jgi:hypothetical protein